MEDSSKLFVFEKKEVLLIFIFICLIAITAFTLGVRFGKQLSLKEDGYSKKHTSALSLQSDVEEQANKLVETKDESSFSDSINDKISTGQESVVKEDKVKLKDLEKKFEDVSKQDKAENIDPQDVTMPLPSDIAGINADIKPTVKDKEVELKRDLSGKYTIQLASKQNQEQAIEFAEPFDAAGYDVIINEVEIPTKGTWYRVSIGAFATKDEARNYMRLEQDLFQGKDYIIKQFD
ncbi:MAG: SPOR domain-containing protein [Bacteriovoracaceae bacterium]|jgi:cell division septation protein DedD|nr:SPOR domain-containing protein [Bacteriovoracaceae bacterium]